MGVAVFRAWTRRSTLLLLRLAVASHPPGDSGGRVGSGGGDGDAASLAVCAAAAAGAGAGPARHFEAVGELEGFGFYEFAPLAVARRL
jgi:hypothetical protein